MARARVADPGQETAALSAGPDLIEVPIMFSFLKSLFGGCPGGRHYFVNQGGRWVCTMCGATQ